MSKDRLNIVSVTNKNETTALANSSRKNRKEEARAKFERLWLTDPEQFDPNRNAMERERVIRTWHLIDEVLQPKDKKIADLGCGSGVFAIELAKRGGHIDAVDIASNALKIIKEKYSDKSNITTIQDYVPNTKLRDDHYDAALSTELIAYLDPEQYRLFFSELSRIIHADGHVFCSTPIDIDSDDALQRFISLAETELKVHKWIFSHHAFYIRLNQFFTAPQRFAKAGKDPEYRQHSLDKRKGISKWWFEINSAPTPAKIWSGIQFIVKPITNFLEQSHSTLILLEKICRIISSDAGISHVIFVGTRRPLVEHVKEDEIPIERKQRKQVWE